MRTKVGLFVVLGLQSVTAPATAFCRKTTAGGDETYDPTISGRCADAPGALPLYWSQSCIGLGVIVDPELESQGTMTTARANEIVKRVISTWTSTQCRAPDGTLRPLAIRIANGALEPCPGDGRGARNEIRFTTKAPDGKDVLAETDLTFDGVDGVVLRGKTRIFDVYAELAASGIEALDARIEDVVRHEMGHFLGLAHSQNEGAIMFAGYDPSGKGGLTDDDVAGVCDVYSAAQPVGAGCGAAPIEPRSGAPWAGALMLTLLVVRRRSRAKCAVALLAALLAVFFPAKVAAARERVATAPSQGATGKPRSVPQKTPPKKAPKSTRKKAAPKTVPPELAAPDVIGADETDLVLGRDHVVSDRPHVLEVASVARIETREAAGSVVVAAARDEPPRAAEARPRHADFYLGARYRVFSIPRALVGLIGRSNKDLFFHSASIEGDIRNERFAIVPALTFADLSTGDLLVGAKGNELASSFSYVRSDVKAVAASVGLLWSPPISRGLSLELGVELGLGVTFGSFQDTWVYESPSGRLAYGGRRFDPCKSVNDGFGCRPQDHQSPTPVRVDGYNERSLLSGGRAPTILPWVSLPLVGVRARLGDGVATRIGVGASFTGVLASISLEYAIAKASPRER